MYTYRNRIGVLVTFCCFFTGFFSQVEPKNANFGPPLKIPLVLAGNFCELRPNHFHTGLDIKTQGRQGLDVTSIADGFVSRIAYSHYGYGLVLYIDHPNGYTSVYAHLRSTNTVIAKKIKEIQYAEKSETFNVYLDSTELLVKKGEVIGVSGSSGSSYAPHLHFEIRETKTEYAVNPLLFNFEIKDTRKPDIKGVKVYPLDDSSSVYGKQDAVYVPVRNGIVTKSIRAHGQIGLGIHATDRLNAAGNICGVYSVELLVDEEKIYQHNMRYMDFEKNRYINHHKDYEEYTFNRKNIHKNYIKGNNTLPIYDSLKNNGVIYINEADEIAVDYIIKDAYSNTSRLKFKIYGEKQISKNNAENCFQELLWDKPNAFDTTNFGFIMSPKTIYDNHCLNYRRSNKQGFLSDVHTLNSYRIPVQQYYTIKIAPNIKLSEDLNDKLLVTYIDRKGKQQSRGGEYLEGYVHAKVRDYGSFGLMIDTTAPYCIWITDTSTLKNLKNNSTIKWKIGDNLSGLDSYMVTIDDQWVLAEYDRKRNGLSVNLNDLKLAPGKHTLVIAVLDERKNKYENSIVINVL